jgi:hypothetical protein
VTGSEGCGGHAGLSDELRALLLTALDRADPVLDRIRHAGQTPGTSAETCATCPFCAVLAALRGERPELAVRLAEHAAGLLAVLRAALADAVPDAQTTPAPEPSTARRVQHVRVERRAP